MFTFYKLENFILLSIANYYFSVQKRMKRGRLKTSITTLFVSQIVFLEFQLHLSVSRKMCYCLKLDLLTANFMIYLFYLLKHN